MVLGPVKRNPEGGLEAWVTTQVLDDAGELQQCEVIVDTGFTGWLTLPVADIRRLGLVIVGYRHSITASDESERFAYYETWVGYCGTATCVGLKSSNRLTNPCWAWNCWRAVWSQWTPGTAVKW